MIISEQDFIKFITVKKDLKGGSIRTCGTRLRVVNRFFIKLPYTNKTIEDFFYYLQTERKLKPNTLSTYSFVLGYIKDYLLDRKYKVKFDIPHFEKQHPPIIVLTDQEIERLLQIRLPFYHVSQPIEWLSDSIQALATFIAYTGCRFDESARLQVKYVDIPAQKAMMTQTKNGEFRFVYFSEPLLSILKRQVEGKEQDDLVFPNYYKKKHNNGDFNERLREMARVAGIKKYVSAHKLRHSFGTTQYESGNDIAMVATLLGHKDIQTTYDTYVHLADKTVRQATYKHPTLNKYLHPLERLKQIKEALEKFNIQEDLRLSERFKKGLIDLFYNEERRLRNLGPPKQNPLLAEAGLLAKSPLED